MLSVTFGIQRRSVIFLGKDSFVLNFAQPTICDEAVLRSGLHRPTDWYWEAKLLRIYESNVENADVIPLAG